MADEIVGEFVAESYESLDRMSTDLVALEQDRTNPETLSSIFRTMHTVKGTCGFLGFAQARGDRPRRRGPAVTHS